MAGIWCGTNHSHNKHTSGVTINLLYPSAPIGCGKSSRFIKYISNYNLEHLDFSRRKIQIGIQQNWWNGQGNGILAALITACVSAKTSLPCWHYLFDKKVWYICLFSQNIHIYVSKYTEHKSVDIVQISKYIKLINLLACNEWPSLCFQLLFHTHLHTNTLLPLQLNLRWLLHIRISARYLKL